MDEELSKHIEQAWRDYHGPIRDEDGSEYLPMMPPAFRKGFLLGFEFAKQAAKPKSSCLVSYSEKGLVKNTIRFPKLSKKVE